MIVCICNALSEERCREAACSEECRTVGCIYRRLGANVQCGRCLPTMTEILYEEQDRRAAAGRPVPRDKVPASA
jgi:bacterioferritin-associated ferredoxin